MEGKRLKGGNWLLVRVTAKHVTETSVLEVADQRPWRLEPSSIAFRQTPLSDEARIGRTEPLYSSQRREAVFRTSTRYHYLKTATTTSATNAAIII